MLCGGISYAQNDTSKVNELLQLQIELRNTYPDSAITISFEALQISKQLAFYKGSIESQTALGTIYYAQREYDTAAYFFDQALKDSEEIGYRKGIMDALTGKGKTLKSKRQWDEAIQHHLRCLDLADLSQGDSSITATNYNLLGNIYLNQHQYENAIKYYQQGAALLPKSNRTKAAVLINIGIIHRRLEDFDKAYEYYLEGLEIAKSLNDKTLIAHCYQKIGALKRKQDELDEAMRYYNLAIEQFKILQNKSMVGSLYSNIGDIYFLHEDFRAAIEQYKLSLAILKEIDDQMNQCYTLLGLGKSFFGVKEYQLAKQYLLQAKKISSELGIQLMNSDATLGLSELYAEQKDYKKAYQYHIEYKALNDSIFNERKSSQIAEMEAKYQTVEKEKEIELLNANNNINELQLRNKVGQRNILIIATVAFLVLIIVLYNRNKIKSKTNAKLQMLDEMKSRFFTNISHEFRTPLTLILGPVEKLLSEWSSKGDIDQLYTIKRNGKRLLELINQLLDLSKLEANQLKLQVSKDNIHRFLHTQISSFESLAQQKEIRLQVKVPREPMLMYFDADKLQKILNNLLSNAFKFTDRGGAIAVVTTYSSTAIKICIKDSGQGIASNQLQDIFVRFHQLDVDAQSEGTGIGLALVKELVDLHKGSVEVDSQEGEGTEFTVSLPISSEAYENAEISNIKKEIKAKDSSELTDSGNVVLPMKIDEEASTVLVVEDNVDVSNYITSLFSKDYHMLSAANGEEGLKTSLEFIPDIIITDLMMPKMDGVALCEKLKQDERTSHIPIIMLTAKSDFGSKIEGLEMGADDYLTKPFEQKELKVRLQNLIRQRNLLKEHFSKTMTLEPTKIKISLPDESFLKKIMTIIEEHMSDFEFSVMVFQKEAGMSRMQLHRKLKALTGSSASEFIRIQRLKRAEQLLSTNGIPVAEAAYSSGFNNLSYFAKCFKEQYGVMPSKYSKNNS